MYFALVALQCSQLIRSVSLPSKQMAVQASPQASTGRTLAHSFISLLPPHFKCSVRASSTNVLALVDSLRYCIDGQDQKVAVTVAYVTQQAEQLVLSSSVARILQAPCRDTKLALKEHNVRMTRINGRLSAEILAGNCNCQFSQLEFQKGFFIHNGKP